MVGAAGDFFYCQDAEIGKTAIEFYAECVMLPVDSALNGISSAFEQFLIKYPMAIEYLNNKFKRIQALPVGSVYLFDVDEEIVGALAVIRGGQNTDIYLEDIKMALDAMLVELDQCGYMSVTIPPMQYNWKALSRVIVDTMYDKIDYVNIVCPNGNIAQMTRPSTADTQLAYEATLEKFNNGYVPPVFPKYKIPRKK